MTTFDIGLALVELVCVVSYAIWWEIKNRKSQKEFNKRWENYLR